MAQWVQRRTPGPYGRSYYENTVTGETSFSNLGEESRSHPDPKPRSHPEPNQLLRREHSLLAGESSFVEYADPTISETKPLGDYPQSAHSQFQSAASCVDRGQPDDSVAARGGTWHPQCLVCTNCTVSLAPYAPAAASSVTLGSRLFCRDCAAAVDDPTNIGGLRFLAAEAATVYSVSAQRSAPLAFHPDSSQFLSSLARSPAPPAGDGLLYMVVGDTLVAHSLQPPPPPHSAAGLSSAPAVAMGRPERVSRLTLATTGAAMEALRYLCFAPDGTLYGVALGGSVPGSDCDCVVRVDTATGVVSAVAATQRSDIVGMAIPVSTASYPSDSGGASAPLPPIMLWGFYQGLLRLHGDSRVVQVLGEGVNAASGPIPPNIHSLCFASDGQLYAVAASSRSGGHMYRLRQPFSSCCRTEHVMKTPVAFTDVTWQAPPPPPPPPQPQQPRSPPRPLPGGRAAWGESHRSQHAPLQTQQSFEQFSVAAASAPRPHSPPPTPAPHQPPYEYEQQQQRLPPQSPPQPSHNVYKPSLAAPLPPAAAAATGGDGGGGGGGWMAGERGASTHETSPPVTPPHRGRAGRGTGGSSGGGGSGGSGNSGSSHAPLARRNSSCVVAQCGGSAVKAGYCHRHYSVHMYMHSALDDVFTHDAQPPASHSNGGGSTQRPATAPGGGRPSPALRPRSEVVAAGLSTHALRREQERDNPYLRVSYSPDGRPGTAAAAAGAGGGGGGRDHGGGGGGGGNRSVVPFGSSSQQQQQWGLSGGCGDPYRDSQGRIVANLRAVMRDQGLSHSVLGPGRVAARAPRQHTPARSLPSAGSSDYHSASTGVDEPYVDDRPVIEEGQDIGLFLAGIAPGLDTYAQTFRLAGVDKSAALQAKARACADGDAADEFKQYLKRLGVSRLGHRQKIWQGCLR